MAAAVTTSAQDNNFAMQAAMSDQFEITAAQMALQKSRRPAIRAYAQHMIDDHTMTTQQLTALGARKGMTLPTSLDPVQQRMLATLEASNRGFDSAYAMAMVTSHRDAAQTFRTEAAAGTDPEIKAFAQTNLPTIEQHVAMAQQLRTR